MDTISVASSVPAARLVNPAVVVPQGLRERIFARISDEQRRIARMRVGFFSIGTVLSLGTGVIVTLSLVRSLRTSGFFEYLSLVFSGDSTFLAYWRELSLSLLDSVPLVTLLTFLVVLLVFVWSTAHTLTNVRKIARIA